MRRFSPLPDGQRHRKETKLKSSFKLTSSAGKCRCYYGHEHLEGYDREHHRNRTAAAAAYSRKVCSCMCQDIMVLLKNTKKTTHPSYPAEELQPPSDDDEEAVPGVITNEQAVDRRNLSDLLKSMGASHITAHFGYCKFLEGLDQQMLKACIPNLS
eukprot:2714693-Pyramimonas_sp.AAC.1